MLHVITVFEVHVNTALEGNMVVGNVNTKMHGNLFISNIGKSWLSIYISAHVNILLGLYLVIYDFVRYKSARHDPCLR
jgi:hypothetical protein